MSSARKTALSISCLAHIVQDGMTATIYVLLPLLAQTYGFSYAQVGLFKGIKSVTQAVVETGSGMIAERWGDGRVLIAGLLLSALGYGLMSLASEAGLVMACLVLIGAGTALHHAPSSSLIVAAYGETGRRGALGLYNSSGDIGKLAFSGTFSLLIGAGFAWQGIGVLFALAAVGAVLVMWPMLGRLAATKALPGDHEDNPGWGILDRRAFATLLLIVFLDTMVQAGVMVFVAFLMLAKGFPLWIATFGTVLLLAGGVFGKAGCGFLSERLSMRRAFVLIQGLTAAGLVAVVFAPGWLALILLVPVGTVTQGSTSITYGLVADLIHPRRMARGYALMYGSSSASSAAGPLLCGVIADAAGIGMGFHAMAVLTLLTLPPALLLTARHDRPARDLS